MDRYRGTACLEWWVNRSTCLARISVGIDNTPSDNAWNAAPHPPLEPGARDDMRLLIEASPYFTLRLADGSAVEVEVDHSEGIDRLRLVEVPDPPARVR
ncbi:MULTISPECIES: hypothetical protein [unclassified Streptomyces]|uniref:hypothetical protein n=1 Tax=unclassified Streptomyces TaxID=2593676 RepID=UPI0038114E93